MPPSYPVETEYGDIGTVRRPKSKAPPPLQSVSARKVSASLRSPSSSPDLKKPTHIVARPGLASRTISRSHTVPQTRKRNQELESLVIDTGALQKMRRWILALAIVEFDVDLGPVIDGVYPPLALSPEENENIAFSSFPDSSQFDQGTEMHSFRIRDESQSTTPLVRERPSSNDGFIYAFSHFVQRRDPSSKRGYQQRSLVLLTHLQYPALFHKLISLLGPLFHDHGVPMMEAACHNIATWLDPTPGATIELGFLGSVLHVELPRTEYEQQLTETSSFREKFNPLVHVLAGSSPVSPPPIALFEASLSHLWTIWECLVLCEPILVFGSTPGMTGQAVWWMRDLLRPIPLATDIRPYFTIHDKDHPVIVNKLPPKSGLLIGVTNPFFESSCRHWPHVLSLGSAATKTKRSSITVGITAGPEPGWNTKTHKRYVSKDRAILKQLEDAIKGDQKAQLNASFIARRHFCGRTTALLVPLNRYLNTLIPPPSVSSRRLNPFSSRDFMASLKAHGSPLPFKSTNKQTDFYERWVKTPAFATWLSAQEEVVQGVLKGKS